jgi:hypothetical protein
MYDIPYETQPIWLESDFKKLSRIPDGAYFEYEEKMYRLTDYVDKNDQLLAMDCDSGLLIPFDPCKKVIEYVPDCLEMPVPYIK